MMNRLVLLGVALGSAAVSAGVTYILTKRHMEKQNELYLQKEVEDVKKHYREVIEKTKTTMRAEAEKSVYDTVIDTLGYQNKEEIDQELAELDQQQEERNTVRSVWDIPQLTRDDYINGVGIDPEDEDDVPEGYVIPRGVRTEEPDYPFTITQAEYLDENDYEKLHLNWYAIDGVMTDSRDDTVPDYEEIIGPDALESFGHLDPAETHICHVRNRALEADYEIVKHDSSYHVTVLGMDPEDLE